MAGSFTSPGTHWTVGEDGPDAREPAVDAGAPSGAPTNGIPLYVDSANDDLYVWAEGEWKGPYNVGT